MQAHRAARLDAWDGFFLKSRAALAIQPAGAAEPVFGVIEINARTSVDKVGRTVQLDDIQILSAKWQNVQDTQRTQSLQRETQARAVGQQRTQSYDTFRANTRTAQRSSGGFQRSSGGGSSRGGGRGL